LILQFIYSDHVSIQRQDIFNELIGLLIHADFFGLDRLIAKCSERLRNSVNEKTLFLLYLLALTHSA
jgi:hypothetical protein